MTRYFFCFTIFLAHLFGKRIEIYEDWQPDAIGAIPFETLERKGYSVERWDRKAYRPFLLKRKSIQNWSDFKHWLWPGLSRKPLPDYLIFSNLGVHLRDLDLGQLPKPKLILFIWEPPAVQPEIWDPEIQKNFSKIYTWNDDLVDGVRFFKFYLPSYSPRIFPLVAFEDRKFLTLIASRLSSRHPNQIYSEREKLIRFFEERPDVEFDLYGRYWEKRKFRSWKGTIADKMSVLKNYRFAIAYENSLESGYITEKLWDVFAAGVVPIYWGAPNIERYVPADCFIDRRQFESDSALLSFLESMTKEEWEGYIDRAGAFLKSERIQKFTGEEYARTVADAVP